MYFTLTLIKETNIFKHVADEKYTNNGNGTGFYLRVDRVQDGRSYILCMWFFFFPMFSTFSVLVLEF